MLRNGWGASAVDAFSTALVMEIPEIVDTILNFIPTIDFDYTNTSVSLFETTIRYLGGMLAGRQISHVSSIDLIISRLRSFEWPSL